MAKMQFEYVVEMEDGSTFETVGDQRDAAAWENEPFGCSFGAAASKMLTVTRYIAWRAGKRQGCHNLSWEKFQDACVHVTSSREDDDTDVDPTLTAASAAL